MMSNRSPRWIGLTILAVCNLVFWVAVAIAMGMVVSDKVDLGVETFIRKGQATARVVWAEAARTSQPRARPTTVVKAPLPTGTEIIVNRSAPVVTWPTPSTSSPTPGDQGSQEIAQPSRATPTPSPREPRPQPTTTLVSSPLLLADPEINSVAHLDAEMERSAPGRAVQIRYREETLNREVTALWKNNPDLPFRDVQVDLKHGQVIMMGTVTVLKIEVQAEVMGTLTAQDCLPQMEIQSISVAGVMTPGFIKYQIEEMIQETMNWYPTDYPLCLEQIVLEETHVTIYGHHR